MKLRGKVEVKIEASETVCGNDDTRCIFERYLFLRGYVCYVFGKQLKEALPLISDRLPGHLRCDECREAFK